MALAKQLSGFFIGTCVGVGLALLALPKNEPVAIAPFETPSSEAPITKPLVRTPVQTKPTLTESLKKVESMPRPMLRAAELTQLGYAAAGTDLNQAIQKLDAIENGADKRAFLRGVFTRVAEDKPPYEAIQRVKGLAREWEMEGFKVLVSQWTGDELWTQSGFDDFYRQLLRNDNVSSEIKDAWLKAYQDHPRRGDMLAEMAGAIASTSPDEAQALGNELKGWEREQFMEGFAQRWITQDAEAAWSWISANRDDLSPDAVAQAINRWSGDDPSAANEAYASLTDPQDRLATATALAPGLIACRALKNRKPRMKPSTKPPREASAPYSA